MVMALFLPRSSVGWLYLVLQYVHTGYSILWLRYSVLSMISNACDLSWHRIIYFVIVLQRGQIVQIFVSLGLCLPGAWVRESCLSRGGGTDNSEGKGGTGLGAAKFTKGTGIVMTWVERVEL